MKAKAAVDAGRRIKPSRRTVAEFLTEWTDAVKESLKPSTYASYVDICDDYVAPKIGMQHLQR